MVRILARELVIGRRGPPRVAVLRAHPGHGSRGRGEAEPIASNDTDAGRRENRRLELAIYANDEWQAEAKRTSSLR